MSVNTLHHLATSLEKNRDGKAVMQFLRKWYPRSIASYASRLRTGWVKTHPHHKEPAYEEALVALANMHPEVAAFLERATLEQRVACHKKATKGMLLGEPYDEIIAKMNPLPTFFADLVLTRKEGEEIAVRSNDKMEKKNEDIWCCEDPSVVLARFRAIAENPEDAKPFDLAVAIGVLTGRRMIEIFSTGTFAPIKGTRWITLFEGQAKKRGDNVVLRIPLLAPLKVVQRALDVLRKAKPTKGMSNIDVNLKYSNRVNAASRELLGASRSFHATRSLYASLAFRVFGGSSDLGLNIASFTKRVLGHTSSSTALHYMAVTAENLDPKDRITWPLKEMPGEVVIKEEQREPLASVDATNKIGRQERQTDLMQSLFELAN